VFPIPISRHILAALGMAAALTVAGCVTIGTGITERAWRENWENLTAGLSADELRTQLGEPFEVRTADLPADADELWVHLLPETIGYRTEKTGEHDMLLPNKRIITVPDYEDVPQRDHVAYHLYLHNGHLVRWERVEP
jgi:hypothetical protein